jgi:hypothetical protein
MATIGMDALFSRRCLGADHEAIAGVKPSDFSYTKELIILPRQNTNITHTTINLIPLRL